MEVIASPTFNCHAHLKANFVENHFDKCKFIQKQNLNVTKRQPIEFGFHCKNYKCISISKRFVTCSISNSSTAEPYNADSNLLNNLSKVKVLSLTEEYVNISSLWKERRAVVAWARHFGCVLCRKRAALLASLKDELDVLGVSLVIIGPGSIDQARAFAEQTNFPGEVYADPTYASFRAMNFIFGARTVFTPTAGLNVLNAFREGYNQDWNLSLQKETIKQGSWYQGGVIVAGAGEGKLVFLHTDKEAGDEPNLADLLNACKINN